ncbi:hypothetical protein [Nocardia sp. bgisy118]|uniref:hypothetical protein n=1 Tax=Nocardia sp. bgisy118 TaxID=3413786 RepID=UPI003F4A28DF
MAEASAVTWSVAAAAVVVLALGGAFGRWRRPRSSDRGTGALDRGIEAADRPSA